MRRRHRNRRTDVSNLPVPPHRPGFWEDLEEELSRIDKSPFPVVAADDGGEVVELSHPEPVTRTLSPWVAASAAAAVVLLLGGATALLTRPAADPDAVASPDTSVTPGTDVESLTGDVATTVVSVTGRAPWAAPRLVAGEAPEVLAAAWAGAENRLWCSALAPSDPAAFGAEATSREADFAGGWGVAWDLPEGPGQEADGSDCADCGRSAFGIAGTGAPHEPDTGQSRTAAIMWTDGSFANIGFEGEGARTSKRIADVVVADQGCLYHVWSNLGEDHLMGLIEDLRFVEGMTAEPVVLRTASDPPMVIAEGEPPWLGNPVVVADLDDVILEKWEALGITGPQLMLADLGEGFDAAVVRDWGSGVAWDNPAGPGHNGQNQPCADCGRGAAGIGWEPINEDPPMGVPLPYRIEWTDGSYAEYGGRLADAALPRDRVLFFDPETGEETVDALQAIVHIPDANVDVVVWSHLGEEHLRYLLDQLRMTVPE